MTRFSQQLFTYFDSLKRTISVQPLNLGGVTSVSGGAGGPPGGFIGKLPQTRITYDQTEAAIIGYQLEGAVDISGVIVSASLVDNLNHIRYKVAVLEGGGGLGIRVEDSGNLVASGIIVLDFNDNLDVTDMGSGEVKIDANIGAITFVDLSDTPGSYTGHSLKVVRVNGGESGLEFSTISGITDGHAIQDEGTPIVQRDNLNFVGSNVVVTDDVGNNATLVTITDVEGHTIQDEGTPVTKRTYLNFEGASVEVTDDAGNDATIVTISGGEGGGHVIQDEGVDETQRTNLNFKGNIVSVTDDVGNDATDVTIAGIIIDPPSFVGCRTYRNSDFQLTTGNGWQNLDWQEENYAEGGDWWTAGGNLVIPEDGYYHLHVQVTLSGEMPTSNYMQVGMFDAGTLISVTQNGFFNSADNTFTYVASTDWYFSQNDNTNIKIECASATQPTVVSGIANTHFSVHKIIGYVIDVEDTPILTNVYVTDSSATDPANETWTEVVFGNERYDTDSMWDGGDPNTVHINTDGYYNIKTHLMWKGANSESFNIAQRIVRDREEAITILAITYSEIVDNGGVRNDGLGLETGTDYLLLDGDEITVEVWHDQGGVYSDAIRSGDGASFISVHKIADI